MLYTKTTPGKVEFRAYSGIEIYGLANQVDEDEDANTGAQLMAQEYVQILAELPKYISQ